MDEIMSKFTRLLKSLVFTLSERRNHLRVMGRNTTGSDMFYSDHVCMLSEE
jgi:hypothetical protein